MKKNMFIGFITMSMVLLTGCSGNIHETVANTGRNIKNNPDKLVSSVITVPKDMKLKADNPVTYTFKDVSVHDPSIIETGGEYYIFGSHLAGAKSKDLMNWDLIGSGVTKNNPIIPDARNEMKEAFQWAKTNTFWAPDVIQLKDGRYYMYYCTCEGSSPLASLGVAVSDKVEGPYKDLGIILKSGMGPGIPSEDGNTYDATIQPNVVDPCLYYDTSGRLWMSYGSYSGGIFILEMNPETGFPLEKGYGKKILGGNHVRIEGSFVIYSPETKYYYMFLSFGGLAKDGGYNIRVIRSKTPDGPFYDSNGNDMIHCKGKDGTFFNDESIYQYGTKLMGSYRFDWVKGEEGEKRYGYVSPGHNSVLYNDKTGQYF
ncbi:family 43 glycosylhydrolase [Anaerocolumna sedimenticola]|uniref:family 43 glycosylhydrolase n=1 Tax=Anaerocolumna sedimenticola TaxID=2696063 RepID=UPI001FE4EDBC|nr:family 43 glycosylhydrolase [Anaerocolumna sedimenticola]